MGKSKKYSFKQAFACGHIGTVVKYGYTEEYAREQADIEFEGLCPSCAQEKLNQERKEDSIRSAELAKKMGLPELTGSPKQVEWAESIRADYVHVLDNLHKKITKLLENEKYLDADRLHGLIKESGRKVDLEETLENNIRVCLENMILNETSASLYIANRNHRNGIYILSELCSHYLPPTEEEIKEKLIEEEVKKENTIIPENYKNLDVTVENNFGVVSVVAPKDDVIINILKSAKFAWSPRIKYWYADEGNLNDRAAEVINKLLKAGFGVTCLDANLIEKAVHGDFKQYTGKTISFKGKGLLISNPKEYNLYDTIMTIKGAKYRPRYGGLVVPIENYKEVLEFAEYHDYEIDSSALLAIEIHKKELERKEKVDVLDPKKVSKRLTDVLDSDSVIIDDLRD